MELRNSLSPQILENKAFGNILSRTSVRRYSSQPVDNDIVAALLHAAMSAPSGVNKQPWEFIVVDDPELLKALAEALPYAKMAAGAPLAIVVCANSDRFLDGEDSTLWIQDLAAASENILLAANAFGLGGVWTCLYPHQDRIDAARRILDIPGNITPFNLIPVGYPLSPRGPMDKWTPSRIHFNKY